MMKKLTQIEIKKREKIAVSLVKEAGKFMRNSFGHINQIKAKGDRDFVTDIDLKAEHIIKQGIIKDFSDDGILSEESPYLEAGDFKWIIDPLDGTHNFIYHIDIFGISVAVAHKEEVVLGVIYMPMTDELYLATRNKGAYRNGRRISVSQRRLNQTTMVFDSSIRNNKKRMLSGLGKLIDQVFNVRMFGSTARSLSYVAEGKVDLEVEYNDKVWDFAAGLLLVEEAGGRATDFSGKAWSLKSKGYIASNRRIHKKVLSLIGSCAR